MDDALQQQLDSLAKSNEALKAELAAKDAEVKSKEAAVTEALKKASEAVPKDYEDLKKKASSTESFQKENEQLKHQLTLKELSAKFPDVNLDLVPAGPTEAMAAHAAKLQAMTDAAVKKHVPAAGAGNASEDSRWKGAPRMGGVSLDVQQPVEETNKIKAKINSASKENDLKGVLDGCFELQPGAVSSLFAGIEGKERPLQ